MDKYAIYTYRLKPSAIEGDWTKGETVELPDMSVAQRKLEMLFGDTGSEVRIQKDGRDGANKYPCNVLAHDDHVVLLRIENEKSVPVYLKSTVPNARIPKIDKHSITSSPYSYVIVDCRLDRSMIAIKVDSDSWRNTDTVRNLLQESINRLFESNSLGCQIEILTKMQSRDFWDYSNYRIKKEHRKVSKMTIFFANGKIDPAIETIIKSTPYLKSLIKNLWGGSRGEVTIYDPIGTTVIDRRKHAIENIVTLITSNIQNDGFGLRMTYDDGIAFTCGKDMRAEFPMDSDDILRKFQMKSKNLSNEYDIEYWLDWIVAQTKEFKDAEVIRSKTNRNSSRKVS